MSAPAARVLVTGWFSFDDVVATVGDERGAEVVSDWLSEAGIPHDIAWASYLERGVSLDRLDPAHYSHLLFVTGPVMTEPNLDRLLRSFDHCQRLAVNVSVLEVAVAGRFDRTWERDGTGLARPDLAVHGSGFAPPVIATVFAPHQNEYGDRGQHDHVRAVVEGWISYREFGSFDVETDLLTSSKLPRRIAQVRATLGRADLIVTSRLHGLVLGLAQRRPVIACDPVTGGAKVSAQARALGWPVIISAERISETALDEALAFTARLGDAVDCVADRAVTALSPIRDELLAALRG